MCAPPPLKVLCLAMLPINLLIYVSLAYDAADVHGASRSERELDTPRARDSTLDTRAAHRRRAAACHRPSERDHDSTCDAGKCGDST